MPLLALLFAWAAVLVTSAAMPQPVPLLLHRWMTAADAHAPGAADGQALEVGDWSKDQLLTILRQAGEPPTTDRAIARGAVLHLDIALLVRARESGDLFPAYPKAGPPPPSPSMLVLDGRNTGSGASSTHLEFARALLLKMTDPGLQAEFARRWYAASAAELALRRQFAELSVHLDHARRLLPDDPEVLVASGYLHEILAGPVAQAALRERPSILVGERRANLGEAQRYFQRALSKSPGLAEARLRLGRVLGLQGRHEHALVELRRALEDAEDRTQSYYAFLFLGRSAEALGRLDAARGDFERASVLFPLAQSPRLALSRLAIEGGDEREARRVLDGALDTPAVDGETSDPWWVYDRGPGRYADRARTRLHRALLEDTG